MWRTLFFRVTNILTGHVCLSIIIRNLLLGKSLNDNPLLIHPSYFTSHYYIWHNLTGIHYTYTYKKRRRNTAGVYPDDKILCWIFTESNCKDPHVYTSTVVTCACKKSLVVGIGITWTSEGNMGYLNTNNNPEHDPRHTTLWYIFSGISITYTYIQ